MSGAVINEFVFNHTGADSREYIELKAGPGADLSALRLLVIEGEGNGWGTVDRVYTPGTADANGYWSTGFLSDQLENGTQTLLLVSGFSGAVGADLDTDDDGTLDATPWTAVLDGVGVLDGAGEFVYAGATALAAAYDGAAFTPGGASRIPDGTDTGAASDWVRNDFDLAGIPGFTGTLAAGEALNTPGAANATAPSSTAVTIADASVAEGDAGTATLTFTVTRADNAGAFTVDFATADGTATAGTDYAAASGTLSFAAGGALSQTVSVTVNGDTAAEPNETLTVTLSNLASTAGSAAIADAAATGTVINDEVTFTEIAAVQGAGHRSPLVTVNTGGGTGVAQAGNSGDARFNVEGVVTAVAANGFYIADPTPDADDATSDGVFVFTGGGPAATLTAGETVRVLGARVDEFRAGSNNLTVTQLNTTVAGATIAELNGITAIGPVLIGPGGRIPPTGAIEDDGFASFDPATDAIDFYESLEGMLVELPDPVAVSPTAEFRTRDPNDSANAAGAPNEEIWVRVPGAFDPASLTPRGGLLLGQTDANPERIQIDDLAPGLDLPDVDVGARLGDVVGVVNYDFQNYEVLVAEAPEVVAPSTLARETSSLVGNDRQLTVASYNVENLDPEAESTAAGSVAGNDLYTRLGNSDDDVGSGKYAEHAAQIALNLRAPAIVALQEVQDNDGAEISADVDAAETLQVLVDLIEANHGITYEIAYANPPEPNIDGGQPNANIRPAYLYRPDQVTLLGATADGLGGVTRITDPNSGEADGFEGDDFAESRKPLEARFEINGQVVTVINNHFNSKGGDEALFGNAQPPFLSSEAQRVEQARIVNARVDEILAADAAANILVVGDLNDFQWSLPNRTLDGTAEGDRVLTDLAEALLPERERYGYNFQGNAQLLDHILASDALLGAGARFDIVHVNSEFSDAVSDHDPSLARFDFRNSAELLELGGEADRVGGSGGADTLLGGGGADSLFGGAGNDLLDGQEGADRLSGNEGDDFYRLGAGDIAVEIAGNGADTAEGSGNFRLGYNIEVGIVAGGEAATLYGNGSDNLLLGGEGSDRLSAILGADSLAGGGGGDTLFGGDGADTLDGGAGLDRLSGGEGADVLVLGRDGFAGDRVIAFETGIDRLLMLAGGLDPALVEGALDPSRFEANAAGQAGAAGGRFVFETDAALLWWDVDGAGAGRTLLARFQYLDAAPVADDLLIG